MRLEPPGNGTDAATPSAMRALVFLTLVVSLSGCCCVAGGGTKRVSSRAAPMNALSAGVPAPMTTGF